MSDRTINQELLAREIGRTLLQRLSWTDRSDVENSLLNAEHSLQEAAHWVIEAVADGRFPISRRVRRKKQ